MTLRDLAASAVTLGIVALALWVAVLLHDNKVLNDQHNQDSAIVYLDRSRLENALVSQHQCFILLHNIIERKAH